MELYAAIDLHSNNSVLVVTDAEDHMVFAKRLRTDLELPLKPEGVSKRRCRSPQVETEDSLSCISPLGSSSVAMIASRDLTSRLR